MKKKTVHFILIQSVVYFCSGIFLTGCVNNLTYKEEIKNPLAQCQENTALMLGKTGQPFPKQCTDYNRSLLQAEYNRGFQIFQRIRLIEQRINDINTQINQTAYLNAEIDGIKKRVISLTEKQSRTESIQEKQNYYTEIKNLRAYVDTLTSKAATSAENEASKQKDYLNTKNSLTQELSRLKSSD